MEHSEAVCVLQQLLMSCPEFQSLSLASSSQWSSLVLQRKMSDFIFSVLPRYDMSALRLSTGVSLSPGPLMINHPNIHIRIVNPEQDVAGPEVLNILRRCEPSGRQVSVSVQHPWWWHKPWDDWSLVWGVNFYLFWFLVRFSDYPHFISS